ncbi:MAG: TetR/AcrR family transcriptional regulator [Candidatus Accumulibacter sp.]|jgi:AcrR family transcriptional regulator|nr:TetR/AcrR family transcriptional regulator [Accumulibacter sp.]
MTRKIGGPRNSPRSGKMPEPRRSGAATRQAILESALAAFTRAGYDGAGVREIVQGAGVTAMMVNRYFGSKERLFTEAVELAFTRKGILTENLIVDDDDPALFCRRFAETLVNRTAPGSAILSGFPLLLRSVSNERATAILRDKIDRHFTQPLAAMLPGVEADERAGLLLSLIAGVQVMRQIIESPALAGADSIKLSSYLAKIIQCLIMKKE